MQQKNTCVPLMETDLRNCAVSPFCLKNLRFLDNQLHITSSSYPQNL